MQSGPRFKREEEPSTHGRVTRRTEDEPGKGEKGQTGAVHQAWVHGAVVLGLGAICAVLYGWTLDFPLEFDDHVYLVDNPLFPDAKSFHYLSEFVEFANRPIRMGYDGDFAVNFILRPVAYGSFYLNHLLDGFHPRYYRLANVVIHGCNAALLYALLCLLLRQLVQTGRLGWDSARFLSITAPLLFVVHPLGIESVTYIVQRFTSMVTLFSLLALWLHFLSLQAASRGVAWLTRAGAVAAMLLAMQTKECSFMVPVLALLWQRLVLAGGWRRCCRDALPLLVCMPLIPVLVALTAAAQNDGWLSWDRFTNIVNRKEDPYSHGQYIITQFTVVAHYLRLLIWPAGLNLDPDWPTYRSIWQGPVLAAASLFAGILGGSWWLYRRAPKNDARPALLLASVVWFFGTVIVSSGMVPLPDLVAEHRSYLPSIGVFMAAAVALDGWRTAGGKGAGVFRILAPGSTACTIAVLSAITLVRNEVWRTPVTLWADTAGKSPGKARVWGNLGTAYARSGDQVKAVECYRRAVSLEPGDQVNLQNMAISLVHLGRGQEALEAAGRLVEMNGGRVHLSVAEVIGAALTELKRFGEAMEWYRRILAEAPGHPQAHMGIGVICIGTGQHSRALEHFQEARKERPNDQRILEAIVAAKSFAGPRDQ